MEHFLFLNVGLRFELCHEGHTKLLALNHLLQKQMGRRSQKANSFEAHEH